MGRGVLSSMLITLALLACKLANSCDIPEVETAIVRLESVRKQLYARAIDSSFEYSTLLVANLFCYYISYDSAHLNASYAAFEYWFGSKSVDPKRDRALAVSLPLNETRQTLSMIESAIRAAENAIERPSSRFPVPPANGSSGGIVQLGGVFWSVASGLRQPVTTTAESPIFLTGYNQGPSCADGTAQGMRSVLADVKTAPWQLVPRGPTPDPDGSSLYRAEMEAHGTVGDLPASFFSLADHLPPWFEAKYPGINNVTSPGWKQHFIGIDIDNPGAVPAVQLVYNISVAIERQAAAAVGRQFRPYLLANEPGFTSTASPFTFDKFRSAMDRKYNGMIQALNDAWNTTFAYFKDIPANVPPTPPPALGPTIDPTNRPGVAARWSDWARFNNERVTRWFTAMRAAAINADDLAGALHGGAPSLPPPSCMVKVQNQLAFAAPSRFGIDRVALTRAMDVSAMDSRFLPADDAGVHLILPREQWAWNASFWAADWASTAMGYTLSRSIAPEKPLLDTEWHDVSTSRYRGAHGEITPSYVRGALWFGASQGLAGAEAWVWARGALQQDACMRNSTPAALLDPLIHTTWSMAMLPGAMDGYQRAGIELSSLGMDAMGHGQRTVRPVRILYSESSFISDELATSRTALVAQAVMFHLHGYPLGWVAESDLSMLGARGIPNDTRLLVVPGSSHVSDAAMQAMQQWAGTVDSAAGGNESKHELLVFGNGSDVLAPASAALRYDSQGHPRNDSALAWLRQGASYGQMDMDGGSRSMAGPGGLLGRLAADAFQGDNQTMLCALAAGADSLAAEPSPAFGVYCGATEDRPAGIVGALQAPRQGPAAGPTLVLRNLRATPVSVNVFAGPGLSPTAASSAFDLIGWRQCDASTEKGMYYGSISSGGCAADPATGRLVVDLPPLEPVVLRISRGPQPSH